MNHLYDGANLAQEATGAASPNRSHASGTGHYLTDALGSTIALTASTATVQTSDACDPFGNPSVSGTPSNNRLRYTGLPNDSTARHDPGIGTTVSPFQR